MDLKIPLQQQNKKLAGIRTMANDSAKLESVQNTPRVDETTVAKPRAQEILPEIKKSDGDIVFETTTPKDNTVHTEKSTSTGSLYSNHGNVFNVGNAIDDTVIEQGTIVSDRRRVKTSISGIMKDAFSEWWEKTKLSLEKAQKKAHTVIPQKPEPVKLQSPEARRDTILEAARFGARPQKDDHEAVIKNYQSSQTKDLGVKGITILPYQLKEDEGPIIPKWESAKTTESKNEDTRGQFLDLRDSSIAKTIERPKMQDLSGNSYRETLPIKLPKQTKVDIPNTSKNNVSKKGAIAILPTLSLREDKRSRRELPSSIGLTPENSSSNISEHALSTDEEDVKKFSKESRHVSFLHKKKIAEFEESDDSDRRAEEVVESNKRYHESFGSQSEEMIALPQNKEHYKLKKEIESYASDSGNKGNKNSTPSWTHLIQQEEPTVVPASQTERETSAFVNTEKLSSDAEHRISERDSTTLPEKLPAVSMVSEKKKDELSEKIKDTPSQISPFARNKTESRLVPPHTKQKEASGGDIPLHDEAEKFASKEQNEPNREIEITESETSRFPHDDIPLFTSTEKTEPAPILHKKEINESEKSEANQAAYASIASSNQNTSVSLPRRRFFSKGFILILLCGGLVFGVGTGIYMVRAKKVSDSFIPDGTLNVGSFFTVEKTKEVPFSSKKSELYEALIKEKGQNSVGVLQLYPVEKTNNTLLQVSSAEVIEVIAPEMVGPFSRSLSPTMMLGYVRVKDTHSPFIILRSTAFDTAFAGMLEWEKTLSADLSPYFGEKVTASRIPTMRATTTPQVVEAQFTDALSSNRSIRILFDETGEERLIYALVNKNTIVITDSTEALSEILNKL